MLATLEETAEVIRKNIESCTTDEHLHICRDMVYVMISERFDGHKTMPEVKEMLLQKIRKKREALELANLLK